MRVYENGKYRDMTAEELAEIENAERKYWTNVNYDDAVDAEIRKRYTASQEFAILRQRDEKPTEYEEYYRYCEDSKSYVRGMIERYTSADT